MNSTVLVKKEPSMTTTNEVKVQKVLVVDDEKSISELITTSLRFVGFEVRTAASGAEALRVAEEFKPHALILLASLRPLLFFFSKRLEATVFGKNPQLFALHFILHNTTQRSHKAALRPTPM